MAEKVDFVTLEGWTAAKRKEELLKWGLSIGGNRNAQINRLYKELERQHAKHMMTSTFMPTRSLLTADLVNLDRFASSSSSSAISSLPVSASRGKRYCLVCRKFDGKVLEDGTKLSLHRFPDGGMKEKNKLRQSWFKSLKLFRSDFPDNPKSHHRVCDDHFVGGYQPGAIPTKFTKQDEKTPRRALVRCVLPDPKPIITSYMTTVEIGEHQEQPELEQSSAFVEMKDVGIQVGPSLSAKYVDSSCQARLPFLSPEDLRHKGDEKTKFYTGFVSFGMFMYMFQLFLRHGADRLNYWDGANSLKPKPYQSSNVMKPGPKRQLRPIEEFLMLCMKLRLNLLHETLADLFGVSTSTVSRILNTWVNFCYDHSLSLVSWPSLEKIIQCLPPHFRDYPNCSIIVDCTEVFIEKPSSLTAQWQTWSEYKHHNTVKILIGVTPNGMVNFVSRLWGGRASDRHITQHDNFLPKLQPNTTIMADKGFTIEDLLPTSVGLNMPPRIPGQRQMTDTEVFQTTGIATPRIVCEMKMEQAKNYRIISCVMPLSEAHLAGQMIFLCFAWTNFQPPLLK